MTWASVSFGQRWLVEISFRGILYYFYLTKHYQSLFLHMYLFVCWRNECVDFHTFAEIHNRHCMTQHFWSLAHLKDWISVYLHQTLWTRSGCWEKHMLRSSAKLEVRTSDLQVFQVHEAESWPTLKKIGVFRDEASTVQPPRRYTENTARKITWANRRRCIFY